MTTPGHSGEQRVGDDERERAMRALEEHFSRGRIDIHEYDERVTKIAGARTADELVPPFEDLPGPHPVLGPPGTFVPPMPPPSGHPVPPGPHPDFPPGRRQVSDKSKTSAGLLQIFLPFGVGRFYTGHTGIALGQLLLFWLGIIPCGIGTLAAVVWCVVDGIVILSGSSTDAFGRPLRD